MSAKQDALIEKQQNYLDFVLAEQPYRKVAPWDKSNARAELAALRESVAALTARTEIEKQAAPWLLRVAKVEDVTL